MPHLGQEPRPSGDYFFGRRNPLMSQGDIYEGVPVWLPPEDAMEPWDVTVGQVMVLTPSCMIDKQPEDDRLLLVAPVVELTSREWRSADLAILRETDCVHPYMYLPASDPWPERVVEFIRAEPIRFDLLNRCSRQSQLTYAAYQQLMRKLGIYFSLGHVAASRYEPPRDDFPDGID